MSGSLKDVPGWEPGTLCETLSSTLKRFCVSSSRSQLVVYVSAVKTAFSPLSGILPLEWRRQSGLQNGLRPEESVASDAHNVRKRFKALARQYPGEERKEGGKGKERGRGRGREKESRHIRSGIALSSLCSCLKVHFGVNFGPRVTAWVCANFPPPCASLERADFSFVLTRVARGALSFAELGCEIPKTWSSNRKLQRSHMLLYERGSHTSYGSSCRANFASAMCLCNSISNLNV